MIITCPACKTEFSVKNSLLQGVDDPQFHCAVCNNYFELKIRNKIIKTTSPAVAPSSAAEHSAIHKEVTTATLSETSAKVAVGSRWQERVSHIENEAPRSSEDNFSSSSQKGAAQLPLFQAKKTTFIEDNAMRVASWPTIEQDINKDFPPLQNESFPENKSFIVKKVDSITLAEQNPPIADFASKQNRPSWFKRFEIGYRQSHQQSRITRGQKKGSYLKVALILSLPLLFFIALWYSGVNMKEIPALLDKILQISSTPKIPPVELELVNVVSDYITLDDGKQIVVVSGKVYNATNITFNDVQIESAVYDKNNRLLAKIIVPLFNNLSTTTGGPAKLNSLKLDVINALQNKAAGGQELKPSHYVPFRVVFVEQVDNASYFSTRVYSVRDEKVN
ncbi:MAG: DUF3426 domain-containing protein [Deltaproteobacteria bacterium]|nr:DUF3426 domain-containing protein [Deltaproteobacteria bacterium]